MTLDQPGSSANPCLRARMIYSRRRNSNSWTFSDTFGQNRLPLEIAERTAGGRRIIDSLKHQAFSVRQAWLSILHTVR